jgi:hypothetical protein
MLEKYASTLIRIAEDLIVKRQARCELVYTGQVIWFSIQICQPTIVFIIVEVSTIGICVVAKTRVSIEDAINIAAKLNCPCFDHNDFPVVVP